MTLWPRWAPSNKIGRAPRLAYMYRFCPGKMVADTLLKTMVSASLAAVVCSARPLCRSRMCFASARATAPPLAPLAPWVKTECAPSTVSPWGREHLPLRAGHGAHGHREHAPLLLQPLLSRCLVGCKNAAQDLATPSRFVGYTAPRTASTSENAPSRVTRRALAYLRHAARFPTVRRRRSVNMFESPCSALARSARHV